MPQKPSLPLHLPALCVVFRLYRQPYRAAYVATPPSSALGDTFFSGEPGEVEIRPVTTENGVLTAMEHGFLPIGTATFTGAHCPWSCAIDVAEEVRADLILMDETFEREGPRPSVIFLPSYSHSYSSGTVYNTRNTAYNTSSYCASSSTTTLSAVPIEVHVNFFKQSALFMRKGNFSRFYGAILYQPPHLPDEAANAEIPVTILAILRGSQAEKDGLRRGARVARINGSPITTRQSYLPFQKAPQSIRTIEVKP